MTRRKSILYFLSIFVVTIAVSACGATVEEPSIEPQVRVVANTPIPTSTVNVMQVNAERISLDTVSQSVDAKLTSNPTPSPINLPVENESFVVQVVDIELPSHVYPGGDVLYGPGQGYMFLGLGIKVTNLTGTDVMMKWSDVYLTNSYDDKLYPMWGAYQKTNEVIDPLRIKILEFKVHPDIDPEAHVYLGDNGYLRLLYRIPKDNYHYYAGLFDLPLIHVDYRRYRSNDMVEFDMVEFQR